MNTKLENFGLPENYGWSQITTIDAVALGGNSGCPVFIMQGKVIGILVGGPSDAYNWVVPVDLFMDDIEEINRMFIQGKYYREEVVDAAEEAWNY